MSEILFYISQYEKTHRITNESDLIQECSELCNTLMLIAYLHQRIACILGCDKRVLTHSYGLQLLLPPNHSSYSLWYMHHQLCTHALEQIWMSSARNHPLVWLWMGCTLHSLGKVCNADLDGNYKDPDHNVCSLSYLHLWFPQPCNHEFALQCLCCWGFWGQMTMSNWIYYSVDLECEYQ